MPDPTRQQIVDMLPRLRAFARSLAPSWDQADDLLQQTVEKGLGNLKSFAPGTRLDSWLFRIMRNTWIDNHRTMRPVVAIDEADATRTLVGEDGRRVVETRLELARVRTAMNRLPEDHRVVMMMVCVEGLRYREVAEILDIPIGTIMSRLSRARLTLADDLGMTSDETRTEGHAR